MSHPTAQVGRRAALSTLPLRRVSSLVKSRVEAGSINSAIGLLRGWLATGNREYLHATQGDAAKIRELVDLVVHASHHCPAGPSLSAASMQALAAMTTATGSWRATLSVMTRLRVEHDITPDGTAVARTLRGSNALAVVSWAQRHAVPVNRVAAIKLLSSQGRWDSALAVAKHFDRATNYAENYSAGVLIPFLTHGGHWQRAARVLRNAVLQGAALEPPMMKMILEETARPATWVGCLALAAMMSRCHLLEELRDTNIYTTLVDACPDWEASLRVLHRAIVTGVAPRRKLVASVMARCEEHGRWAEALSVMSIGLKAGFVGAIGPESHRALVASFHASAAWDRATRAVMWMSAAGQAASEAGLPTLLALCARSGSWETTAGVASAILLSDAPTTRSVDVASAYVELARAAKQGSRWVEACALLSMATDDVRLNIVGTTIVDNVLSSCGQAQHWQAALGALAFARDKQPRTVLDTASFGIAYRCAVASGRPMAALQVLETQCHDGHAMTPALAYSGINTAVKAQMWETALRFTRFLQSSAWRTHEGRQVLKSLLTVLPPSQQRKAADSFSKGRFGSLRK
jgi:hypothetical protein